ncbi:serine/threonine protein kinase [Spirulina sp. CS-785/01]|uniref:serine/threonine-protein kinase n=1 Tax=Spirulina sp. CS-785/01 TaxID=3021716 RepID=UPI00232F76F9|nr:serine/threonine-protein kinase [Spirulina sp. CS-785/01]MDB9311614.1 serine/threonine protein kinase [Spirulina sp. CS-785/01]
MVYCLNPKCQTPKNADDNKFCICCGSKLSVGDRYRATKTLSEAGRGRTFAGIDLFANATTPCVIKQVQLQKAHSDPLEEFRREAEKLLQLGKHPQIPQLLAYIELDKNIHNFAPTLIQEQIKGQSVEKEQFGETEIRNLLNEILPILEYIHGQGIIHRDLNPQNILRTSEGKLVLVDFSTAKVTTKTALAKTGTVVGSAAYSAPEQLRGKATYASDLYSLGVICVHLLTQIHPFDLFSSMDGIWVWTDYLTQPVSELVKKVLNKLLAEAVNDRYQSASEVYEELNGGETLEPTLIPTQQAETEESEPLKILKPHWSCIASLEGHNSSVHTLAFHPRRALLASGSADRAIALWNLEENVEEMLLKRHRGIVDNLVFRPNEDQLISGSWDYTVRVWVGGEEVKRWQPHDAWVTALAISPDGQILATGSADQTIKLLDANTGEEKATFQGHQGTVESLTFSPDGQVLVSSSADQTLKLWDITQETEQATLEGHDGEVYGVVFSPSGQMMISGSEDCTLKLWELSSGKLLQTWTEHTDAVTSLAISSQGNMLISGSRDQTAKIWHPGTGRVLHTLTGHESGIKTVAIAPNNATIATGSQDKIIKLWQFR